MSDLPKIGRNERSALCEIAARQSTEVGRARPYFWRKASMLKLEAHGLVRRHPANRGTEAQPGWLVTEAGFLRWRELP